MLHHLDHEAEGCEQDHLLPQWLAAPHAQIQRRQHEPDPNERMQEVVEPGNEAHHAHAKQQIVPDEGAHRPHAADRPKGRAALLPLREASVVRARDDVQRRIQQEQRADSAGGCDDGHVWAILEDAYRASDITVSCGLTVRLLGKTLASQTYRFSQPCTRKSGPITPQSVFWLMALPPCG